MIKRKALAQDLMEDLHTAYLSIGSNKGKKQSNLDEAVRCLDAHAGIRVTAVSRYYRTAPQNYTDQDWFVNAALKVKTRLDPGALLAALKEIETTLDREGKAFRFGPRKIDLDIIFYENQVVKTQALEIPHPRMHDRCFVLIPLMDIGPNAVHPVMKMTPEELLGKIDINDTQAVIPLEQEEQQ